MAIKSMEHYHENIDQERGMNVPLLSNHPSKPLGGVRTLPFILANEGFERAAYYGLLPNMILYLLGVYNLDMPTASNILFCWSAATCFAPILGAFLADTHVGRFRMIGFGSVSAFLGMMLLWSTTIIPGATPSHEHTANDSTTSKSSTLIQLVYICIGLGLMSMGAGGIRSSSLAFGADQLLTNQNEEDALSSDSKRTLETFISWYSFCSMFAMASAVTSIVYIQDHYGWRIGFAIPVLLMFLSTVCFFSASSIYVKVKPMPGALTRLAQVVVASWRNRHYRFSSLGSADTTVYHVANGSTIKVPTEKLRFLNKACIVRDHRQDLSQDGMAIDPWSLCTIDQVEDFKVIINILPIWSSAIMNGVININIASFVVLQAKSMDRHLFITSSFEIPSASFGTFALASLLLWIVLYERVFIPSASRVMGKPVSINSITRMGMGMVLGFACMVVAGYVENARRDSEINSALWLVPQSCLIGLAEGILSMAQIEFFYSMFPKNLSSISSNLFGLSLGVSSLVASLILNTVNYVTGQGGKQSWVSSDDPNKAHYDYFYWLLAALGLLNFVYFLLCSRSLKQKNMA